METTWLSCVLVAALMDAPTTPACSTSGGATFSAMEDADVLSAEDSKSISWVTFGFADLRSIFPSMNSQPRWEKKDRKPNTLLFKADLECYASNDPDRLWSPLQCKLLWLNHCWRRLTNYWDCSIFSNEILQNSDKSWVGNLPTYIFAGLFAEFHQHNVRNTSILTLPSILSVPQI